jgi:hypothetical protein
MVDTTMLTDDLMMTKVAHESRIYFNARDWKLATQAGREDNNNTVRIMMMMAISS